MSLLSGCIERGLDLIAADRAEVETEMANVRAVAATVDAAGDGYDKRLAEYERLLDQHSASTAEFSQSMAARMKSWKPGLFIGDGTEERRVDARTGGPWLPEDNYGIERSFKVPKGHARRVHGRAHAGVALVQRGATLVPALDAHVWHPAPFSPEDLQPYYAVPEPAVQTQTRRRALIMRKARSEKQRSVLLAQLEGRYAALT